MSGGPDTPGSSGPATPVSPAPATPSSRAPGARGPRGRGSRLLPASASPAARLIVGARALRGFADGLVSVLLAVHLTRLGLSPVQVGAIVTGTLLGSAALTLAVGLFAGRVPTRTLLLASCGLMFATGIGFASVSAFAPLLLLAVVGTLNPSAGDVSVFLPTEQSQLADEVAPRERPHLYARYNLAGALAGAVGALASGLPGLASGSFGVDVLTLERVGFLLYALVAVAAACTYRALPREQDGPAVVVRRPLRASRRIVLELAALFSIDSAASGLVVQSLLVLWLRLRFDLSVPATATVFFLSGLLGAASQLLAGRVAARIGLVRAMAYTHLPANALLIVAGLAPSAALAVGALLLRALCSQMDVPARQAFVMAVVPPEERAAAASVTNVPRSLASAATPLLGGYLLSSGRLGWPLAIAGVAKIGYDLVLLARFGSLVHADDPRDGPDAPNA